MGEKRIYDEWIKMGLFTTRHSEYDSELERALLGVPFSDALLFDYDGVGKERDKKTNSPAYILPVEVHGGGVYGHLRVEGKLVEAPIGLSRKTRFFSREQYEFDHDGGLVSTASPQEGALYFPLKLTDLLVTVGITKEGTYTPNDGSPFPVYGIESAQGVHPLIIVSEMEGGIRHKGLYKDKDGKIHSYEQRRGPSHGQMRDFLRTFRGVTLPAPAPKVMNEGAAPRTEEKKEQEKKEHAKPEAPSEISWEEPKSIVAYLNQYVVGQEDAKMVIAVAFSNYMTKVRTKNEDLYKENLLLIGPSGVGKTYMLSLLAKKANLPMAQTKLTGKSSTGYKNENLSTVFEQFRALTTGEAPYGVIFFDEIDKLAHDEWGSSSGFGPRLQDELIGWLEEAMVLGDEKDQQKKYNGLNTRNILFVTAGAFQGVEGASLEEIIGKRLGKGQRQIGFGNTPAESINHDLDQAVLRKVRPEDLINYGLKPELVGRLPALGVLAPLTVGDKVRILTTAKRSTLTNYVELLSLKGYTVELDGAIPEIIAQRCPEETGARALSAVCNDLFTEILFDPQQYADASNVIRVTPELARKLINLYG